jgi:hypothetical protein
MAERVPTGDFGSVSLSKSPSSSVSFDFVNLGDFLCKNLDASR